MKFFIRRSSIINAFLHKTHLTTGISGGNHAIHDVICSGAVASQQPGTRSIVTSCRGVVLPRFGGPEVLEIRDDVAVPDLQPNEVLVRARAVSINPLDTRVSASLAGS